ncbi:MAG: MFS transporter, partial [Woeseia sp.]
LPRNIGRTRRSGRLPLSAALRAPLLQLDLFVFLLHTMLTAMFVALPFVLSDRLGIALASHWYIYVGALLLSLAGTVPLILRDERRGKRSTLLIAVALLMAGQLSLFVPGGNQWLVLLALAVFFAGFNFLEAALPARLSILAEGELRGASLGLFSSCQFSGAFAGGLLGGLLLTGGDVGRVFLACAALAGLWLLVLGLSEQRSKAVETT